MKKHNRFFMALCVLLLSVCVASCGSKSGGGGLFQKKDNGGGDAGGDKFAGEWIIKDDDKGTNIYVLFQGGKIKFDSAKFEGTDLNISGINGKNYVADGNNANIKEGDTTTTVATMDGDKKIKIKIDGKDYTLNKKE